MDKLLYYPYINIPQSDWLYKSVLYWDDVGAIVPERHEEQIDLVEPYMDDFLKTKLVHEVSPDQYVRYNDDFRTLFNNVIDIPSRFNQKERSEAFKNGDTVKVHINKFNSELMRDLEQRGLLEREGQWSGWYEVETHTACLLMTYAAHIISVNAGYTPSSDDLRNFDINIYSASLDEDQAKIREQTINDILPYISGADAYKIRAFKESKYESLKSFRRVIEKEIVELSKIESIEERDKQYNKFISDIKEQKEDILAKMNESKLGKVINGSVWAAVGTGGTAILLNDATPLIPLGLQVIKQTKDVLVDKDVNQDPLYYLALMDKKFGS
ncbi:MAG: hypothetical protein IH946_11195 [Bacteroidetes bacterium]|nr:hypothetical protein [Bacteroidota bacterium]